MRKLIFFLLIFCRGAISIAAGISGLNYTTYYPTGSWTSPNQNTLNALTTGTVSEINFNWNYVLDSGRTDGVVVKFTGYFKAETTGTYQFGLNGDDGVQLIIDNQYVIDYWYDQGPTLRTGTIYLTAGSIVPVTIWYYENGGGSTIKWYWWNNNNWQIVPSSVLATDGSYWGSTISEGTMIQTNAPNNQIITSGPTGSAGITTQQQSKVNIWNNKTINDNGIFIDQIGDNNSIVIVQIGDKNKIGDVNQKSFLNGNQNSLTINQGVRGIGQNDLVFQLNGDLNSVNIGQSRNSIGESIGVNGHYSLLYLTGNQNSVTIQQTNQSGIGNHYMETTILGNYNSVISKQLDNGNKIMFGTISGSNNTSNVTQQGTGQHYVEYKLTGNDHNSTIVQSGSSQNKASVDLINMGGPATLNLTQSGGKSFSIIQSCAIAAGCYTTVNQ